MTPNRSCNNAATSAPRGDLLGARVPSRSKTKSFLMMFLQVGPFVGLSASMTRHRPHTTLNERQLSESWAIRRGEPSSASALPLSIGLSERFVTPRTEWSMWRLSRRSVSHVTLMLVALGVVCLGFPTASAFAVPVTTTTLSPATVAAGNAYALQLLDAQRLPPEARAVAVLPTPIDITGPVFETEGLRQVHHFYLLPMSISVETYVRGHLPKGSKVMGTGSTGGPNVIPVYSMTVSLTCVSRHITFCGVTYAMTAPKNGEQELAVGVQVIYLPILHVKMPTNGVVTVTGYGKTSLMDASSDPSSVVLTSQESRTLRTAVAGMKDLGSDGGCQEDSLLLKIKVVKSGKVVWRATADACPGALSITSGRTNAILDNRTCSFWRAVDSFFATGAASATKSESKYCNAPLYG